MSKSLLALALAMLPNVAVAQADTSSRGQSLPRDVRREVEDRWNAEKGLRSRTRIDVEPGREIKGNVAVQNGPLFIGGHVTGNVLAVNADVVLRPTARIDGDLLVVGGEVDGRNAAYVGGEIRIYRQTLRYETRGDSIIAEQAEAADEAESWWRRLERRNTRSWSDPLRVAQAGPYNRVEGLPVSVGPSVLGRRPWGSFRVNAAGVVRTGSSFAADNPDVGYNVNGDVRYGSLRGVGVGARLFDVVDPVEDWQLSGLEVALASFLFHRDYRDYYERHGGSAFVTLFSHGSELNLTGELSEERWTSRNLRDPFTLFYNGTAWRPNPAADEGPFHVARTTLVVDSRTDPEDPWSGWFANADVEAGRGQLTSVAPSSVPRPVVAGSHVNYARGFLDLRRYNRLSPEAQVNLRVVLGGWLGGDQLPMQRRLSVDGAGSLPGYDFRSGGTAVDVGACSVGPPVEGLPAQCERIALAQIEYRGDIAFGFGGDWDDGPHYRHRAGRANAAWVVFADAGRGWLIGPAGDGLSYPGSQLPPLSTFRSDVGVGLDFFGLGFYLAKSVSTPGQAANFFVRLRHRF